MKRLRVTATLAMPVIETRPIHLDALLAAAWLKREAEKGRRHFTLARELKLPLLRLCLNSEAGHVWFWAASRSIWPPETRYGRTAFTKRADAVDVEQLFRHNPTSGPTRDYLVRLSSRMAPTVSWLCFGHKDGVESLLKRIKAIGENRAKGWGEIASWKVAVEPGDPLGVILDNGCANRNLPAALSIPGSYSPGVWRPPYTDHFNEGPCVPADSGLIVEDKTLEALRVQFTHENGIRRQRNRKGRGGRKHRAERESRVARISRRRADG